MEQLTEILKRVEKRVERLERKIREIERKPHYTTVTEIQKLTGWKKERLRAARQNGEVVMKRKNGKILYDLSSIHPLLIKTA